MENSEKTIADPIVNPENNKSESEEIKKEVTSIPYKNFESLYEFVSKIYNELGHDVYQTREQIAKVQGLSPNTIKQQLSSAQQFGLLELKHGTGYKTTELFARIHLPGDNEEKKQSVLESLKILPLYNDLLQHYEKSGILPNNTGLSNTIVRQFGLSMETASRIARELVNTLRLYGILDEKNILRIGNRTQSAEAIKKPATSTNEAPQISNNPPSPNTVTVTIPLRNGNKADVILPSHYENNDLKRIIRFINALIDPDDAEENGKAN